MKQLAITLTACSLLAFASCGNNSTTNESTTTVDSAMPANEAPAATADAPVDSATMAKAWEEYMMPGDMHKMMEASNGKWDAEMSFWQAPDAPPMINKASVENKMIMGGRYQLSTYKGDMGGMAFEGTSTMGYDNAKQKFVNTWVDNMGTGMMYMEGPWDAATNSITMTGTMVDPVTKKETTARQVFKYIDSKTQVMEMYDNKTGKEYKSMEIKLTKK